MRAVPSTRWIGAAAVFLATLAGDASARPIPPPPPPAPVTVIMEGPKSVKVRVAAGVSLPCDSTGNNKVFDGKVPAGWWATWMVASGCVCIEQTYEDFPDVGWGEPWLACRPMVMTPYGWMRSNDPIVVTLRSTPPPK